ncbi:MAG: cytochrome c3 family protein [Desulfosarcinaceae bacterium]
MQKTSIMRRQRWTMTVLLFATMLIAVCAPMASAGTIVGSPHDFRGYHWNRSGEICTPCHAPHTTKPLPAPLWNLEASMHTYTVYSETDRPPAADKENRRPNGMSKTCLSCHDGIVAPDRYGGMADAGMDLTGRDPVGTHPTSNHPVSFIYDTALATTDKDLYDPSTRLSGLIGSAATIDKDMLFAKQMECSSCHDVHNTKAVPGTKLLVKDNAGSVLCLTCHNK